MSQPLPHPSQNPYASLSPDSILSEFLTLYSQQILPNATNSTQSAPIQVNAKAYLKTLDSQAEILDYIHLQSANLTGKLFPVLHQQQQQMQDVFAQIDALYNLVKSHRRQVNHLNQVLQDIDAHTKTYSRFVPKFMRTKATKDSLADVNVEKMYRSFQDEMRQMRRRMGLDEEVPEIVEEVAAELVPEEATVVESKSQEMLNAGESQQQEEEPPAETQEDATTTEEPKPVPEQQQSEPAAVIVTSEEESDEEEDEGEVIIAEGESDEEEDD